MAIGPAVAPCPSRQPQPPAHHQDQRKDRLDCRPVQLIAQRARAKARDIRRPISASRRSGQRRAEQQTGDGPASQIAAALAAASSPREPMPIEPCRHQRPARSDIDAQEMCRKHQTSADSITTFPHNASSGIVPESQRAHKGSTTKYIKHSKADVADGNKDPYLDSPADGSLVRSALL